MATSLRRNLYPETKRTSDQSFDTANELEEKERRAKLQISDGSSYGIHDLPVFST